MGRLTDAARDGKPRLLHQRAHPGLHLPAPTNPRIVACRGALMARHFAASSSRCSSKARATQAMSEEERARLASNIALAEQLGATWRRSTATMSRFRSRVRPPLRHLQDRHGAHGGAQRRPSGPLWSQIARRATHSICSKPRHLHHPRPGNAARRRDGREHSAPQPPRGRDVLRTLGLSLLATAIGTTSGTSDSPIPASSRLHPHRPAHRRHHDGTRLHNRIQRPFRRALQLLLRRPGSRSRATTKATSSTFAIMFATAMVRRAHRASPTTPAPLRARTRTGHACSSKQINSYRGPWRRRTRPCGHEPAHQALKARRGLLSRRARPSRETPLYEPAGTEDRSASLLTDYERALSQPGPTPTTSMPARARAPYLRPLCLYLAVRTGDEVFGSPASR